MRRLEAPTRLVGTTTGVAIGDEEQGHISWRVFPPSRLIMETRRLSKRTLSLAVLALNLLQNLSITRGFFIPVRGKAFAVTVSSLGDADRHSSSFGHFIHGLS